MPRLALLVLALSLTLAGCSKNTFAINGANCESWATIYPSRRDVLTDDTAKQIVGNNAARKSWCGSDSPKREAATS